MRLPPLSRVAVFHLAPLVVLGLVPVGARLSGRPVSDFFADPVIAGKGPPWVGSVSNLGVVLWLVAAMTVLMTAVSRSRTGSRDTVWLFLLCFGAFTLLLGLDDLFLLHERVFPRVLKLPEFLVIVTYGAIMLTILIRFRGVYTAVPTWFLVTGLLLFTGSVVFDLFDEAVFPRLALLEEQCKFLGIASWLGFSCELAEFYLPRGPVGGGSP